MKKIKLGEPVYMNLIQAKNGEWFPCTWGSGTAAYTYRSAAVRARKDACQISHRRVKTVKIVEAIG